MKKLLLFILSCLCACTCFFFGGCSSVGGTYKFQQMSYVVDGTEYTFTVGQQFEGKVLEEDFAMVMFDGDKVILRTCEVEESGEKNVDVMIGTWVKGVDDEIYLDFEDMVIVATKDGKTLTGEMYGMKVTLTK